MGDELGLLDDYGHLIISGLLMAYGILLTILINDYGPTDD